MIGIVYYFALAGLVIGVVISWLFFRIKMLKQRASAITYRQDLEKEAGILNERINIFTAEISGFEEQLTVLMDESKLLNSDIIRKDEQLNHLKEKLEVQKGEMVDLQKRFKEEFENLANRILDEKTKKFTEHNKQNLDQLLTPFKEKIISFEKRVEETYVKGLKDQGDLKAEIKSLHDLNVRISDEARDLTKALKGDMKKQGNWGEVILERVLERSGLTKGVEYDVQVTAWNQEGEMLRPDVIIRLPEKKHIIIDSKVSLIAYEASVNADTSEERASYLKQHIESIKNHVKQLSEKNYILTKEFNTPDFVLLFMPVESAFSAAIQADVELFNYAWTRKIVIVSPTTMLATLKTIESIWRQEKQTQNALEIARQGGNLYDKLITFIEDLDKLGKQLNTVSKTYDDVHKKFTSGRGDLISRAKKLEELGAKTSKRMPGKYDLLEENEINETKE